MIFRRTQSISVEELDRLFPRLFVQLGYSYLLIGRSARSLMACVPLKRLVWVFDPFEELVAKQVK